LGSSKNALTIDPVKTIWNVLQVVSADVLLVVAISLFAGAVSGCGNNPPPKPCAPNDRSCLPCTNPWNTDPACAPFPTDAKRKEKKEQTR